LYVVIEGIDHMRTEDIPEAEEPSLWLPEQDIETHQILAKLGEEASELAGICLRSLMQGLYGIDPDDGRQNREHLSDEIADVEALIQLAKERLQLTQGPIIYRSSKKYAYKASWFDAMKNYLFVLQERREPIE
jgi:hypothetical protein